MEYKDVAEVIVNYVAPVFFLGFDFYLVWKLAHEAVKNENVDRKNLESNLEDIPLL